MPPHAEDKRVEYPIEVEIVIPPRRLEMSSESPRIPREDRNVEIKSSDVTEEDNRGEFKISESEEPEA